MKWQRNNQSLGNTNKEKKNYKITADKPSKVLQIKNNKLIAKKNMIIILLSLKKFKNSSIKSSRKKVKKTNYLQNIKKFDINNIKQPIEEWD